MTGTLDLFTYRLRQLARFPEAPGFKGQGGTSQAAAEAIKPRASRLRDRVLDLLTPALCLTADECADLLGESILSIRPRLSELVARGLICDSGMRRKNRSQKLAIVWRVP